jgi:23S rRNA (guanosine2251-2'-O)-methyltransferase
MRHKPHERRRFGAPGRPQHRPERHGERAGGGPEDAVLLFGIHAVEAALGNPARVVHTLHLTDNAERRLHAALTARRLAFERVLPRDLDRRLGPDTVHQGALLETQELPERALSDMADAASFRPLIVLDQVTDPHNVGAILRSAAVFGAAGLVMTRRHSPPLDGTLAKSASGALETVPVIRVQNLARALTELKEVGFTVVGLDGEASDRLEALAWSEQTALVLGAEGKGLRQLTRDSCDVLCRISTDGPLASLNVSNAAAIALHHAAARRLGLLRA